MPSSSSSSAASRARPTVLVTGACGFTGRGMVRKLCDAGYDVRAGDIAPPNVTSAARAQLSQGTSPDATLDPRATFVHLDVTNEEQVSSGWGRTGWKWRPQVLPPLYIPSC
jgi:nucleoside-diphosphate-sugar epimerase